MMAATIHQESGMQEDLANRLHAVKRQTVAEHRMRPVKAS